MGRESGQKLAEKECNCTEKNEDGEKKVKPKGEKELLINRKISDKDMKKITKAVEGEIKFIIVGDLDLKSKYARSILVVTDKKIYAFDDAFDGEVFSKEYGEIKKAYVKRYYGNAMLILAEDEDKKKRTNFIRFSYKVASLYDAAAYFIENIASGKDMKEEMDAIEAAFEKQFSVCPKCGRTLIRPGAECMNCQSKNKMFKKMMKYVTPYKAPILIGLLLSCITTLVALVPPYMTKQLVDEVFPNKDERMLIIILIALVVSYIVQYGVGFFRSYILRVAGEKVVTDLRKDIYAKAQHLPMTFYDRTSTGSVINRILTDAARVQDFVMRITQEVVIQFFQMIGIIVIMMTMHWRLTLLSLIPVPIVVIGAKIFGEKISPYYRRIWRRWSAATSVLTDTLPGIRVIKAFTNEDGSTKEFGSYNDELLKTVTSASKITIMFPHIVSFIVTCGSLLIWGIGGFEVITESGSVSPGLLISFISYASMFYGPVSFFANLNDTYQNTLTSAERLLDIIDAEPENDFGKGNKVDRLKGKFEFRNVNFSFDRTKKTLNNVNLTIEPGDIVGIVGTTGAGKSTIINLLMRYYDHYDGEILVDGINIRDIDMESYRSQIGYVQQEPMMFHDSVFNNIAYGCDNPHIEQVINAAEIANAHEFIARLPDGYDTVLGERGIGVSGGERQRLSIARAILKNPSVLFFDEATASVDSETESQIQEAIERLISGRTTIMIAHRLSTLRKANKIIVVDKGEIIEMGSPEELMALKGKYYKLIQIQTMSDQIRKTKEEERFE